MRYWHLGFLAFFIIFSGCGRKQRTIFLFPKEKEVRLTTLQLSSPKIILTAQASEGTLIKWLKPPYSQSMQQAHVQLVGYNIYKLTAHGFIPKNPLNSQPLTTKKYCDTKSIEKANSYVVRALFKARNLDYMGPASNIGSCQ